MSLTSLAPVPVDYRLVANEWAGDSTKVVGANDQVATLIRSLENELGERQERCGKLSRYYEGAHPLLLATQKFQQTFGGLFGTFSDNWCRLVVDAAEERLNVEGFRFGDDDAGDTDAWDIWQANNLDAESQLGHTEALIHGYAYALVDEPDPDVADDYPVITVEHPAQVVVRTDPRRRRLRTAAFKRWVADDGYGYATLFRRDYILNLRTRRPVKSWGPQNVWEVDDDDSGVNPFGLVPVVPLLNRARLAQHADSEITSVIPIQDAVNKLAADLVIASEFAAFRQRWAIGIDIPKGPDGQPTMAYKAAMDRLWVANPKTTAQPGVNQVNPQFGEFSASDLNNYVQAIEMFVQHIASQSRTPPHYFYMRGEFPSGESIKAAETGLVSKVRRKMRHFGEGWEEVMRLAFLATGNAKATETRAETIWADPESRTEGEHIDSVLKKQALGVPWRQLMEDAGYSQVQINRMESARRQEMLEQAATIAMNGGADAGVGAVAAGNGPAPVAGRGGGGVGDARGGAGVGAARP